MNPDAFAAMISGLEAQGLSRPEIVRQTGLAKSTIWRYAVGDIREPSWRTVEKLMALQQRVDRREKST